MLYARQFEWSAFPFGSNADKIKTKHPGGDHCLQSHLRTTSIFGCALVLQPLGNLLKLVAVNICSYMVHLLSTIIPLKWMQTVALTHINTIAPTSPYLLSPLELYLAAWSHKSMIVVCWTSPTLKAFLKVSCTWHACRCEKLTHAFCFILSCWQEFSKAIVTIF